MLLPDFPDDLVGGQLLSSLTGQGFLYNHLDVPRPMGHGLRMRHTFQEASKPLWQ